MQHELFRVHVTGKGGAAMRCHLGGDYQLVVKDSSLCLSGVKVDQVKYEWVYPNIRCYGYTDKVFSFVFGRLSSSGEGMFSVRTKDGLAIYEAVHEKVQTMKKNMDFESLAESLPLSAVHVQEKQPVKKSITGRHGCKFVYSEPYKIATDYYQQLLNIIVSSGAGAFEYSNMKFNSVVSSDSSAALAVQQLLDIRI